MKTTSITLVLIIAMCAASGQTYQKTIGSSQGDNAMAVVQTTDGGYVTCGSSLSFGNNNSQVYLVKTNDEGDTLWTRTYDFGNLDYGNALQMTNDGGFIIAGRTFTGTVNYDDVLLMKVGADGSFEWAKAYGGGEQDQANAVRQTSDGGFVVAGYTTSYGAGLPDIYLVKTSANGDLEWTKTYGGTVTDEAYDVWQNEDGGYIVAGSVRSFLPDNDGVLMRLNASGEIIWSESIGGVDSDGLFSVQQTLDGGFVAAGVTALGLNFDFLLVKVDENGAETWTKQIGGGGDNYCYQVKQAEDGGYALAGYYVVPFEGADGYLVRTDSAGDTLWTRTYGGPGDDQMKGFTFTDDGGYMLSGHTTSFGSGNGDFYNVKTNANGESNCDEFNPDVELIEANVDYEVWDPEEGSGGDVWELIAIVGGGGFTQTNCTSVDLEDAIAIDHDIRIFPNPAHDIINVQSTGLTDDFSWRILNFYGQVVATGIFPSGHGTIDISNISDGQYVLEYQHEHVMVEVMK